MFPKYRKGHSNVFEWRLIVPDPWVHNIYWLFFIWCSSWLFLQIIFLSMWFHSLLSNYFQQVDQESLGQKVQDGIRTLAFRGDFSHFCMILSLLILQLDQRKIICGKSAATVSSMVTIANSCMFYLVICKFIFNKKSI